MIADVTDVYAPPAANDSVILRTIDDANNGHKLV